MALTDLPKKSPTPSSGFCEEDAVFFDKNKIISGADFYARVDADGIPPTEGMSVEDSFAYRRGMEDAVFREICQELVANTETEPSVKEYASRRLSETHPFDEKD
ncbi:MAG: hypothetical protein COU90_01270 [Candidatus Ryanbacteria bacterium CG10_big_fil_rev_8_21_14_0_10_43_42]|uniref:Uncharacterized protein n=1 Tax=Candidatus Ryanbacteria bacterium CG10_big_fil_rev_8_21_14_0_10_43_42 TaxID=1974864 RepID=A0A2M8KXL9_9BACT|nr:MAG: hypothetical protein COU90_01270 [Candidatus Ryanbacteria bacterium CG10_big_fil_rev_8_21_14_0_10_43_42]